MEHQRYPYMAELKEIVIEAGELLLEGFYKQNKGIKDKSELELVTRYDTASEELIKRRLACLEIPVVAEESGGRAGNGLFWTVDPLDGTNNFAFGIPHFAVTVALMDQKEPVLGVVYDPVRRELFSGEKGNKAYLNESEIYVSSRKESSGVIAATGFSYDRRTNGYDNMVNVKNIADSCRGIRRMGAASLDLAYVAAGRFDGYWERGLKMWDMAAGALIVREAGGIVTGLNGETWDSGSDHILADNGYVHDFFVNTLEHYEDSI